MWYILAIYSCGHFLSMSKCSFPVLWLNVKTRYFLNPFCILLVWNSLLCSKSESYAPLKTSLLLTRKSVLGCKWYAGLEPFLCLNFSLSHLNLSPVWSIMPELKCWILKSRRIVYLFLGHIFHAFKQCIDLDRFAAQERILLWGRKRRKRRD